MRLSRTEVNLRRLLAAAPQQQNQAKLLHYVATMREQVEKLAGERTSEGLPRVSKAKLSEYSEQIEAIAAKLAAAKATMPESQTKNFTSENPSNIVEESVQPSEGLRRRLVSLSTREKVQDNEKVDRLGSVKLDAAALVHIDKHRKLQEDLTEEMVGFARQLKESSLLMSQSVRDTAKILDSTEKAVEHSLASTGHASAQTTEVSSGSLKTTCFMWLVIFAMTCIFVMVVLLIRVT